MVSWCGCLGESLASGLRGGAWSPSYHPLGSAPARLLRLLRACLAALGSSALPEIKARPPGAPPAPRVLELAASKGRSPIPKGARRFPRVCPCRWRGAASLPSLDSAGELWITRKDWVQRGVMAAREACAFTW